MKGLEDSSKCTLVEFDLSNDWNDEDMHLYDKAHLCIKDGDIICFVGCNGSGKSTSLMQIDSYLNRHGYAQHWQEGSKGIRLRFDAEFDSFISSKNQPEVLASLYFQSTGESLTYRFSQAIGIVGNSRTIAQVNDIPIVVMLDDCDAGTSIDVQCDIINIIRFIHDDMTKQGIKHAIVIAANSYELCRAFKCIDCATLNEMHFETYEQYKGFVMASRKKKDERNNVNS